MCCVLPFYISTNNTQKMWREKKWKTKNNSEGPPYPGEHWTIHWWEYYSKICSSSKHWKNRKQLRSSSSSGQTKIKSEPDSECIASGESAPERWQRVPQHFSLVLFCFAFFRFLVEYKLKNIAVTFVRSFAHHLRLMHCAMCVVRVCLKLNLHLPSWFWLLGVFWRSPEMSTRLIECHLNFFLFSVHLLILLVDCGAILVSSKFTTAYSAFPIRKLRRILSIYVYHRNVRGWNFSLVEKCIRIHIFLLFLLLWINLSFPFTFTNGKKTTNKKEEEERIVTYSNSELISDQISLFTWAIHSSPSPF